MTMTAKKYTRRESERLRRSELILAAAEKLFLEKGFAAATMNDIGEAAEFGRAGRQLPPDLDREARDAVSEAIQRRF